MKKFFQKKYLLIFLGLLCLSGIAPAVLFADLGSPYYQAEPLTNYSDIVSQKGSTTIVNRSNNKYFVPNKTMPEWDSFYKNAPAYVSISVCGDEVCGEGETNANCPGDCPISGYCGDGICDKSTTTRTKITYAIPKTHTEYDRVCVKKVRGWLWVPAVNVILLVTGNGTYTKCNDVTKTVTADSEWVPGSETWESVVPNTNVVTCKDDCAAPISAGCGVCGYEDGALCPNYCNDRGYNMVNCVYQQPYTIITDPNKYVLNNKPSIKKYLTAADALAVAYTAKSYSTVEDYSYHVTGRYTCNWDSTSTNFCPAGSYCALTGGLRPGTSATSYATAAWLSSIGKTSADLQRTCDPGFFCPVGASYERPCPINTYSIGGATNCTNCPAGTKSPGRSTSIDECQAAYEAGDNVCNIGDGTKGETPTNSTHDCPDASQAGTLWNGDGRCSGAETITTSPSDCSCGNGICDNGETYLSCLNDCYCLDSVCGTEKTDPIRIGESTTFLEGRYCKTDKGNVLNSSDCKYMNTGEVCGNGTCEAGEGYNSSLGRIVCPLDCHCGDGYCGTGESYSSTNAAGSCNLDCHCGDNVCSNGESSYSCMADCHCGSHTCDNYSPYYENSSNCSTDCKCGDNICSSGETSVSCPADCSTKCDRDFICESGEYMATCLDCKNTRVLEK